MTSDLTRNFPAMHDETHLLYKSQRVNNHLTIKNRKLLPAGTDIQFHFKEKNPEVAEPDIYANNFTIVDGFTERPNALYHAIAHDMPAQKKRLSASVRETLMPDESVAAAAHFHIMYIIKALLVSCLIFIAGKIASVLIMISADYLQGIVPQDDSVWASPFNMLLLQGLLGGQTMDVFLASRLHSLLDLSPLLSISAFYIGAASAPLFFLWRMVQKWTTEIIVTNKRLLFKRGVFITHFIKIDLRQMYQTEVNQTLLGKILGYGSLYIYTTIVSKNEQSKEDNRNISLPPIAEPHKFGSMIEIAKRALRVAGD